MSTMARSALLIYVYRDEQSARMNGIVEYAEVPWQICCVTLVLEGRASIIS